MNTRPLETLQIGLSMNQEEKNKFESAKKTVFMLLRIDMYVLEIHLKPANQRYQQIAIIQSTMIKKEENINESTLAFN